MFDIGWDEMLFTAIVAIVVIGPKDLPRAMRTAGQWIGKVRRVSSHFRSGIETMIREAEIEEMEKQWREQNEAIMAAHPPAPDAPPPVGVDPGTLMEPLPPAPEPVTAVKPKGPAKKAAAKKPAVQKSAAKPRAKAAK
ncbi:MAG: Sec-independent protein translocase protein TatB [Novosphingobium sp.]